MMKSNVDFIRAEDAPAFHCGICGKEDLIPSRITIEANYGSVHDGEHLSLDVCGECIDFLWLYLDMASDVKKER